MSMHAARIMDPRAEKIIQRCLGAAKHLRTKKAIRVKADIIICKANIALLTLKMRDIYTDDRDRAIRTVIGLEKHLGEHLDVAESMGLTIGKEG